MDQELVSHKRDYIFSLNRLKISCSYDPVNVDFIPIITPTVGNKNQQNIIIQHITPTFNQDHKHYTPSFILPIGKQLQKETQSYKQKFDDNMRKQYEIDSIEDVQMGGPNNQYCKICQEYFQNYWDHINEKYHRRQIRSIRATVFIKEICQQYGQQYGQQNRKKKKNQISQIKQIYKKRNKKNISNINQKSSNINNLINKDIHEESTILSLYFKEEEQKFRNQ